MIQGMRHLSIRLVITAAIASATAIGFAALPPEVSDALNGIPAAEFGVNDVAGKKVSMNERKGKIVLINFFATWCPPCRSEIKHLSALQKKYEKQGASVIGVAVDSLLTPETVPQVEPFVKRLAMPYPVLVATEKTRSDYHFKGIPTTIVVGQEGKIVKTFYGYHDGKKLEGYLDQLMSLEQSPTGHRPSGKASEGTPSGRPQQSPATSKR